MKQFSLLCYFLISALLLSAQSIPNDTVKTKRSLFKHKKHKQEAAYTPYCSSCEITQFKPETYFNDDDADGVYNVFDLQLNTPALAPVDSNGVAVDSDGDGVLDFEDAEPCLNNHASINYDTIKLLNTLVNRRKHLTDNVILPYIYFQFNTAEIVEGQDNLVPIKFIADFLKNQNGTLAYVTGHCSPLGVEASNRDLKFNRAVVIINKLIEENVQPNQLAIYYPLSSSYQFIENDEVLNSFVSCSIHHH